MSTTTRGWTLLIYEVNDQGHNRQKENKTMWTRYRLNQCVHLDQTWQTCQPWREDEPYWFWRSIVKVTNAKRENNIVNAIQTRPPCTSLSNLVDELTMARGWTLWFGGQMPRSQWTYIEIWPCEHDRLWIVLYIFVKLDRYVNHCEKMSPIDWFWKLEAKGQSSGVKTHFSHHLQAWGYMYWGPVPLNPWVPM